MASKLVGLFKTLDWNDFTGTPDANSPNLAFTSAAFDFPNKTYYVKDGSVYKLDDNVTITITFNAGSSWKKMDAINAKKLRTPAEILKHEQGHYDIVALIARDLFIDVMQLKAKTYATDQAVNVDLSAVLKKYSGKDKKITKIYDDTAQTNHGENGPSQDKWNAMIKKSLTTPRVSGETAPDGTAYKIQFLDVLSQGGISV